MSQSEQFRVKRQRVYEDLFSAKALLIAGLLVMPAILFVPLPFLYTRVSLFFMFWFLAWLCGKKNNPLITLSIIFFIIFFNLLVPIGGQVLFTIGGMRFTVGALWLGIQRAVTLAGLIMLSRVMIRRDLKIPGLFGELMSESFRLYSIIMNTKPRIRRKTLIADLDQMMIDLSDNRSDGSDGIDGEVSQDRAPSYKTKPLGFVILIVLVLFFWLIWFYSPLTVTLINYAWFLITMLIF
jgi:heptaprenyl diphosphate synthase